MGGNVFNFNSFFLFVKGRCLKGLALYVNGHDDKNQKRFFPISVDIHFAPEMNPKDWYIDYLWKNVTQGSLECCSDTFIEMHYVKPKEMNLLELFIYYIHPFGLQKNLTESLPRKLTLEEIIESSDQKIFAKNYRKHKIVHQFDDDEKY